MTSKLSFCLRASVSRMRAKYRLIIEAAAVHRRIVKTGRINVDESGGVLKRTPPLSYSNLLI